MKKEDINKIKEKKYIKEVIHILNMNDMSIKDYFVIAIVFLLFGIIVSLQYKSVQKSYLAGLIPSKQLSKLTSELTKLKDEKEKTQEELRLMQSRLDEITHNADTNSAVLNDLKIQLDRYKALAGYTSVQGEGIVVEIDNDKIADNFVKIEDEYQYILLIINELNASGAEAISINNQRYVSNSEIRYANGKIMINSTVQESPFVIKAIGAKDVLLSSLNQRFGFVNILRDKGFLVSIVTDETIVIPKYSDNIIWRYASSYEKSN